MNRKIGVFDSGIGGITVLKEIIKNLPNEDYLYYCDSKNNPYGEKSDIELLEITNNIVNFFIKKDVKIIVVACNTATTRCIKTLRKMYPDILFVGTEPAIKLACSNNYKNILVMATPSTMTSKRTNELINLYKKDNQNIMLLACEGLANKIETNDKNGMNILLDKLLFNYKNKNIDCIVLGCTHYPYIKKDIKKRITNCEIIDGSKGVAKQVKKLLTSNNLLNKENKKGKIEIIYPK